MSISAADERGRPTGATRPLNGLEAVLQTLPVLSDREVVGAVLGSSELVLRQADDVHPGEAADLDHEATWHAGRVCLQAYTSEQRLLEAHGGDVPFAAVLGRDVLRQRPDHGLLVNPGLAFEASFTARDLAVIRDAPPRSWRYLPMTGEVLVEPLHEPTSALRRALDLLEEEPGVLAVYRSLGMRTVHEVEPFLLLGLEVAAEHFDPSAPQRLAAQLSGHTTRRVEVVTIPFARDLAAALPRLAPPVAHR